MPATAPTAFQPAEMINSIRRLMELDHDATTARLQDMLYKSYLNFGNNRLTKSVFVDFLAGDIEINVQGIAARWARLQENNS